jgi:hypothetical protein
MLKPVLKSLATRALDLPVSLLALGFGSTEVGKQHLSPAPDVGKNGIRWGLIGCEVLKLKGGRIQEPHGQRIS